MQTATATETRTGFAHRCPACGEQDTLQVALSDTQTLTCSSCDVEWSTADLRAQAAALVALCDWVDTAPAYRPTPGDE